MLPKTHTARLLLGLDKFKDGLWFPGKKDKRGLVALSDGSIVDEALLSPNLSNDHEEDDALFQQSLRSGLAGFVGNLPVQNEQKDKVRRGRNLGRNYFIGNKLCKASETIVDFF